jgi:hypothetical protein
MVQMTKTVPARPHGQMITIRKKVKWIRSRCFRDRIRADCALKDLS